MSSLFVMNFALADDVGDAIADVVNDEVEALELLASPQICRATTMVSAAWMARCMDVVEVAYMEHTDQLSSMFRWEVGPWEEGDEESGVRGHQKYLLHEDTPGSKGQVVAMMVIQRMSLDE